MDKDKNKFPSNLKELLDAAKNGDVIAEVEYLLDQDDGGNEAKKRAIVAKVIPDDVVNGIMKVRDTGETNMFDTETVKVIADHLGEFALFSFFMDKSNHKNYADFIMTGKNEVSLSPCVTITFYGDEKFINDLKQKLFNEKK